MAGNLELEALVASLNRSTGFDLSGYRRDDLVRVLRAMEAEGAALDTDDPMVFDRLVRELTVGETTFFRHAEQFEILERDVLATLGTRPLRIWSAGCATGEEAYSIAITLRRSLPEIDERPFTLLATDINDASLAVAARAEYGEWSFRATPSWVRDRWLVADGNRWRVPDPLKRVVTFARLNLATDAYPTNCDVIFCRNVLIYFDEQRRREVVERLTSSLAEDGLLFVGHADLGIDQLAPIEPWRGPESFVYRRRRNTAPTRLYAVPASGVTPAPQPRTVRRPAAPPKRAVSAAPQLAPSARVFLLEATVHLERGDDEHAAEALRKSLYLQPDQPAAHYLAGCIELRRGTTQLAMRHFRTARRQLQASAHHNLLSDHAFTLLLLRQALERELEQDTHDHD